MGKVGVELVYHSGLEKPMVIGATYDSALVAHCKRVLLREAEEAIEGAEALKDEVVIISFRGSLDKLRRTLESILPSEFDDLYSVSKDDDES